MIDDLTAEEKETIKKNIEAFKIKIHWELDHYTDDKVLIFGNDRVSTTTGDMRLVMFKLACMIDQMAQQTGKNRKDIVRGIRKSFVFVDAAKRGREE